MRVGAIAAGFAARAWTVRLNAHGVAAMVVAAVWLVHGLYNKLLGGSSRHLAIVQAVPGLDGTVGEVALASVGVLEVAVALWVLSARAPLLCAATQTVALLSMNIIELTFARDLLLWPAGLVPVNLAFLGLGWFAAVAPAPQVGIATRLRRHPFAVNAHFDHCLTLTYAVPADVLRPLLPPGLELDVKGEHGFVAVALVQTRSLRPAGLPALVGQDFFLAGYRVFAKFRTPAGTAIRGLRILRSDADRALMVAGGNLLTHYNYHRCDASTELSADSMAVRVRTFDGGGDLVVRAGLSEGALPPGSPFKSIREARYFAGPLPFTFDYEAETHAIVAIGATRSIWRPTPVAVEVERISFFDQAAFAGCTPTLAAAFHVANIDYRWEKGMHYPLGVVAPQEQS
jgi:uncharacterized protein YqjF (DUF2071 family)